MRHILIISFFIHVAVSTLAQKSKYPPPPSSPPKPLNAKQLKIERRNHDCIYRTHKTLSQRINNFPFNKAREVQFVSFYHVSDEQNEHERFQNLPTLNDTVCYSKLYEVVTLTSPQIDSLTDIFYNVGFRGEIMIIQEMNCYDPRNAILFLNDTGKVFAYIEICFSCEQTYSSSEKINIGDICKTKFDLIRQQFRKAGIEHGTEPDK